MAAFRGALMCVLALGVLQPDAAAAPRSHTTPRPTTQQIEVLFLSSLDPDSPDVASLIEQAEAQILNGTDKPVRFSFDYLDFSSSLADPSRKNATTLYLVDKYRGKTFQLVIAIGEETLSFAEQTQAKLFPDAAVLFFVVDPKNEPRWLKPKPSQTGVVRESNYLPTLQLALRQNPGTSRVIVVSGSSDTEQRDIKIARDQFHEYESSLKLEYLTDLELSELTHRLSGVEPGTVILFLDFESDASGEQFIPARILPAISRAANRPIYGTFSSVVGNGAVGGSVAELGDVGRTLGQAGARILKGEKAENIPIATGDFQHYVVDWRQLHRFGIAESELPPDSVLLNWEYSPWERYRWRVLGLSAVLLIETVLIVLLLRNIVRRKRAQEALTRNEKELAEAQRLARIGSWSWDANRAELSCSEELHRICGLDRAVPLPRISELSRLFTPESWERLLVAKEKAWQGSSIEEIEVEVVRPDGENKWVRTRGEVLRDTHGRITYVHGTVQDITDRKKSQVELQESENRLTAIVDSAMDAIIAVDDQQHILLFNASAEKMFGCTASSALGSSMGRFIPERFRAAHVAHLRRFGDTGVTTRSMGTTGALWAVRTNGEEFPIEASISHAINGSKKLFTVIIRDITERRRAEEAAAESERRFRLIANTAPVLIWMAGPDRLCNYFNEPWLVFTGRRLEQELGNGWSEGVHADDLKKCLDTYTQSFDRRERFSMEYRLRRHDAEYRWVLDIGVPRFNGDGSFAGYVGCCMDISDMKEARATLVEFSGGLIRAGEREGARIARELHDDINQRLALLANGLQEVEYAIPASTSESQKQELQELWRLTNEIATDIQHISHQLHPSKLHYLGLASTVRDLCREFSQQYKIEIDCAVSGLPENLDENVSLNLFRTVQESLRNVVKHSHARHVKVELTCQSGMVHLHVSDDGVGFNPDAPRLNHGLGLVSMRERLRSVGGSFSIWSRPSLGTLVEGTVPAVRKAGPSELTVADPTDAA
jgi:PAS domain S-box-containing protein